MRTLRHRRSPWHRSQPLQDHRCSLAISDRPSRPASTSLIQPAMLLRNISISDQVGDAPSIPLIQLAMAHTIAMNLASRQPCQTDPGRHPAEPHPSNFFIADSPTPQSSYFSQANRSSKEFLIHALSSCKRYSCNAALSACSQRRSAYMQNLRSCISQLHLHNYSIS
jgi:hypothetical protein